MARGLHRLSNMRLLFALPRHERLGDRLADVPGLQQGRVAIERFSNREMHASIETPVEGHRCLVLASTAPPDEQLLATLLVADTLRRQGAATITAVIPYLGYSRQDREQPGKSLGLAWVGALLAAVGIAEVTTVDIHSAHAHRLLPMPLRSFSPAQLFAGVIRDRAFTDATVIAPDEGARERGEAVRQAAAIARPLAYFSKTRTETGIVHRALRGSVSRKSIIVDDILDTGATLVSACEVLRQHDVQEILIFATHGIFTGTGWRRLLSLGVRRIYCTDTVPLPETVGTDDVAILSIAPLLADALGHEAHA